MLKQRKIGALMLCAAAVCASAAYGRTTRDTFTFTFPGVDVDGNLDDSLGADGVVKETFNDRTGRLRLVGRAVVQNDSHHTHTFSDVGVLTDVDGDVVRDNYRVTARGRATYNGLVNHTSGTVGGTL